MKFTTLYHVLRSRARVNNESSMESHRSNMNNLYRQGDISKRELKRHL